jgi:putative sterol carrier protein
MTAIQESLSAANDFKSKMNENKRVRKLLKRWSPLIHFDTKDSDVRITFEIRQGEVASVDEGHIGDPDLVVTFPTVQDLTDMFVGRLDPTPKYLSGEILVKGHQADVIKLDAITMIIWPEN